MLKQTPLEKLVTRSQDRADELQRTPRESLYPDGSYRGIPYPEELQAITMHLVAIQQGLDELKDVRIAAHLADTQEVIDLCCRMALLAWGWRKRGGHKNIQALLTRAWALLDPSLFVLHGRCKTILLALGYLAGNRLNLCRYLLGLSPTMQTPTLSRAIRAALAESAFSQEQQ